MADVLPTIIYLLLIALIIVAIIVGIKLIGTINKVNDLVDDVQNKVSALDKVFDVVNFATDKMSMVTEVIIGFLTTGFKKVFKSTKKSKKTIKEDEIDE